MHSNLTSRIVVGIGLAVIFAVGVSVVAVRVRQEQVHQAALNAPARASADSTGQNAADATTPPESAAGQNQSDQTAAPTNNPPSTSPGTSPSAPPAGDIAQSNAGTPANAGPAASAGPPASEESTPSKSKSSGHVNRHVASAAHTDEDAPSTRVASAAAPSTIDMPASTPMSNNSSGVTNNNAPAPEQAGQDAATSAGAVAATNEQAPPDSQITTAVKSEIGTAAPGSNVDVTTKNGVVVLAGSVPSEESIARVRQAAERVAGVNSVDASALIISNQ
jgi:hyperosmotically inducible periplasmic protein